MTTSPFSIWRLSLGQIQYIQYLYYIVISFTDSSTKSTPTKSTKSNTKPAKDSLLQDDDETTREDSEKDASFTLCEDPSNPDLVLAVQALGIVCATHRTQRVLAKALTERQREREDEERRKDSITTKVTTLLARTLCISPSPSTAQTPVPDDLHRKPPFIPKTPQQIAKDGVHNTQYGMTRRW